MSFKKLLPIFFLLLSFGAKANYMLVQNVTKVGNNPSNKTIQIQFDLSWQNSWRDSINWDAAWIFIKFKDANGLWQHARLNLSGYVNGAGTTNTIKVASDSVGAFVYRDLLGSGNFNVTSMQIQWNYGASGLTDVSALEVRVFATEMVYVPDGDFNCAGAGNSSFKVGLFGLSPDLTFNAPGSNFPVINNRLSPVLTYNDQNPNAFYSLRIKGDAGLDTDNNGSVDNSTYPVGYKAFYCFKYEMTEQQYADFLNTLTSAQISTLGVAGTGITLNNGQYFSSTPNRACVNATNGQIGIAIGVNTTQYYPNAARLLAFADWAGIRPISFTEFNKASYGPLQPVKYTNCCQGWNYPAWGSNANPALNLNIIGDVGRSASGSSNRTESGASYYGILDMTGNAREPVVKLNYFSFSSLNGNGSLNAFGNHDIATWSSSTMLIFIDQANNGSWNENFLGFRYARSAE